MAVLAVMTSFVACGDKKDEKRNDSSSKQVATENNVDTEENAGNDDENAVESENNEDEQETVVDDSPITVDDVLNHSETPAEDFEYVAGNEYSPYVRIEKYIGTDPIVVIPETIDGYPVTNLSNGGLATESSIVKGIKIPSGVTELSQTFNCNEAVQIVLADGVEKVGDGTFNYNSNLKYIDLGNNLKEISPSNFFFSVEIHIPDSVAALECTFWSPETATIIGAAGSYAETYANEKGIKFVVE